MECPTPRTMRCKAGDNLGKAGRIFPIFPVQKPVHGCGKTSLTSPRRVCPTPCRPSVSAPHWPFGDSALCGPSRNPPQGQPPPAPQPLRRLYPRAHRGTRPSRRCHPGLNRRLVRAHIGPSEGGDTQRVTREADEPARDRRSSVRSLHTARVALTKQKTAELLGHARTALLLSSGNESDHQKGRTTRSAGGGDLEGNRYRDLRMQPHGHLVGTRGLDGSAQVNRPLLQRGATR